MSPKTHSKTPKHITNCEELINPDKVTLNKSDTKPSAGEVPKIFKNPNQTYTKAIIIRFIHDAFSKIFK